MSSTKKRKYARKERHRVNKEFDSNIKKSSWESGKLIEENHNSERYTSEYSDEIGHRLQTILQTYQLDSRNNQSFINEFRNYRDKIRDYLLYCKPGKRNKNWEYLKNLYETYQDNPDNLINVELDHD